MNNDRFLNTYVELLTSTLHDALGKNIVFQAQAKISGEDIEELKNTISSLNKKIEEYENIEHTIEEKNAEINSKNAELGKLKIDFDNAKNESAHLNTFRNELVSARQEVQNKINELNNLNLSWENKVKVIQSEHQAVIEELNNNIAYLQMTPAQRRKFDTKNAKIETATESNDGGSF
jgi:chromosome segregation ATPase